MRKEHIVFSQKMNKQIITFRTTPSKTKKLDELAASVDRDRSFIINEAVDEYLEVRRWQTAHIREGLKQANSKRFASATKVKSVFKKLRK